MLNPRCKNRGVVLTGRDTCKQLEKTDVEWESPRSVGNFKIDKQVKSTTAHLPFLSTLFAGTCIFYVIVLCVCVWSIPAPEVMSRF